MTKRNRNCVKIFLQNCEGHTGRQQGGDVEQQPARPYLSASVPVAVLIAFGDRTTFWCLVASSIFCCAETRHVAHERTSSLSAVAERR
jgi:hypothetical protein